MISFKQFLFENVVTSRRQGLTHLRAMKPVEFIDWLDSVKKDAQGVLTKDRIQVNLKLDGLGFRFGKDVSGKIFIEGSRTGPQTIPGVFSSYAKSKNPDNIEIIQRATHYDDILRLFQSSPKTQQLMEQVPNNTKIYCELFYVPMAQSEDETGVVFVTMKYDKAKLGSIATIGLYDVMYSDTGTRHADSEQIMKNLETKGSTKEIKVIQSKVDLVDNIDIRSEISLLDSLLKDKSNTIRILKSRKAIDKPLKHNIVSIIDSVKSQLEDKLLFNPAICGMDRICDIEKGEGLVFHLGKNFGAVKVINPSFEQQHHGHQKT